MRGSVREPERRQRERDEAGAAAPNRTAPHALLRLQATAGNQAVGRLLRMGKRAKDKLPGRGVDVKTMQAFQDKGGLSDADVDAMLMLTNEQLHDALTLDAKRFKDCADDNVEQVYKFASAASNRPVQKGQREASPRDALALELQGHGVSQGEATQWITSAGVGVVKSWVAGKSDTAIKAAARLCTNAKDPVILADVDRLIDFDAGLHDYGEDLVLSWAADHGIKRVRDVLDETRSEKRATWVQQCLELGVKADSTKSFKDLVRLKARLKDGVAGMSVLKADVLYAGAHDAPESRTGFLRYAFGGGQFVELHTHWNQHDCKIVSIHVKEGGDKSTELNAWPSHFFGEINTAVVTAHNAGTGNKKATTVPAGRALTL